MRQKTKEHNLKGQEQRARNRHHGNCVTYAEQLTRIVLISQHRHAWHYAKSIDFSKHAADIMLNS
jgi:hypothetical protein